MSPASATKTKTQTKTKAKAKPTASLNIKEQAVLAAMPHPKGDELVYVGLAEIAGKAFNKRGTSPATKGNSWVRNSMRKLLKLALVKHKAGKTGTYARTKLAVTEALKKAA